MTKPIRLLLLILGTSGSAMGQTVPDAGAIRQQIDSLQPRRLTAPGSRDVQPKTEALLPLSGVTVTVQQFVLTGNTLISSTELQKVLQPYLSRTLDFTQLQSAAATVAARYRRSGWVVRVFLPRQEIHQGVVTIQVVESVLGKVRFEGEPPRRVSRAQIQQIIQAQQAPGAPLNSDQLERADLIANALSGARTSIALVEGDAPQTTDAVVQVTDTAMWAGDVSVDNTGAAATGRYRFSANAEWRSPSGNGDTLGANWAQSLGSDYLRVNYGLPVGDLGWRVGANASYLQYRLVSPELLALHAQGRSDSLGLEAMYPWVRTRQGNLSLMVSADSKNFDNQANARVSSHYSTHNFGLGLTGNSEDSWGGGGANTFSASWVSGQVNLNGSPNQVGDMNAARTQGGFAKLRFQAARQQVLGQDVALYTAYAGQLASKNLDSSERFYLGGANGVRAYPANEAGGSEGQIVNLELRTFWPQGFVLTGFYDWGQVRVNRYNDFSGAALTNVLRLKGAGLALAWQSSKGFQLKATWARRIGVNPSPNAAGNDQDGTLERNRFWLSATAFF
jgi:hemolysin activation/secretion protein